MDYKMIPLGKPLLGNEEIESVRSVIKSRLIAYGNKVEEFEKMFAKKIGRKYCIMVNSGTSALWIGMKALGLKKSVIIPSLTCNAVLNAVLNAGLNPIFADVDKETHNIDLSSVPEKQLEWVDAVIVTHTYGHSADMDIISQYIKEYDLILIEDFAQATGGYFKNRILGSFGKISITSFYGPKIMTTGYGGAILTDDIEVYEKCVYMRGDNVDKYYHDIIPMNLRMTDIQAAIGIVQLEKLDRMIEMRRNIAEKLRRALNNTNIGLPIEKGYAKHTYYKFAIILPENIKKSKFIEKMGKLGIATGKLYDPPLHKTRIAMNVLNATPKLPISEFLSQRAISLPIYPELSEEDIIRITNSVKFVINN